MTTKEYLKEWDETDSNYWDRIDAREYEQVVREIEERDRKIVQSIKYNLDGWIKEFPDKNYPNPVKKDIMKSLDKLMKLNPKVYKFYRKRLLTQDVASYIDHTKSLNEKLRNIEKEYSEAKAYLKDLKRYNPFIMDKDGNLVNMAAERIEKVEKKVKELEIKKEKVEKEIESL